MSRLLAACGRAALVAATLATSATLRAATDTVYYWAGTSSADSYANFWDATNWKTAADATETLASWDGLDKDAHFSFGTDAYVTVNLSTQESIREILLTDNAHLTLKTSKKDTKFYMNNIKGEGSLTVASSATFSTQGSADSTLAVPLEIPSDVTLDIYGNKNQFYVTGGLSGSGTIQGRRANGAAGMKLGGNNEAFEGAVVMNADTNARNEFSSATAGGRKMSVTVNGGGINDNGKFNFSSGTIEFGKLTIGNLNVSVVSGMNIGISAGFAETAGDETTISGQFNRDTRTKGTYTFNKCGAGVTKWAAKNIATLNLENGVLAYTSDSDSCLPTGTLAFKGGAFRFDNETVVDPSAKIKDSTADIRIDTNGNSPTFGTQLAASNKGGIVKLGAGTLTLAYAPATTGAVEVAAGTLQMPMGATIGGLTIADGAALVITDAFTESGDYDLFTLAPGVTALDETALSRIAFSGTTAAITAGTPTVKDGKVVVAVTATPLTWKNDSGNWTDAANWTLDGTDTAATFADGDSVILASGTVTLKDGETVKPTTVTVNADATPAISGNGTIETATFSNAGTVSITGDGSRVRLVNQPTGAGTMNIGTGATLAFDGNSKDLAQTITGEGTMQVTNGALRITVASGSGDSTPPQYIGGFGGTVEIVSGGELYTANNGGNYTLPATMSFKLAGGKLKDTNGKSVFLKGNIATVAETESTIDAGQNNYHVEGDISGGGTLNLSSSQRGIMLRGNNAGFSGTVNWTITGTTGICPGFYGSNSGSADAVWNLTSNPVGANDRAYTYRISGTSEASPLHLGAFNVTQSGAVIGLKEGEAWIVVGEKAGADSAIEGKFTEKKLHLTKAGAGTTLTLGEAVTMVEGSTIAVEAGTLTVNASDLTAAAVTVAEGATLAGAGKVKSVEFAAGALVAALPDEPDTSATYNIVTVASEPTTYKNASIVSGTTTKGKWKLKVRANDDGTYTLYAEYNKNGLLIIVR